MARRTCTSLSFAVEGHQRVGRSACRRPCRADAPRPPAARGCVPLATTSVSRGTAPVRASALRMLRFDVHGRLLLIQLPQLLARAEHAELVHRFGAQLRRLLRLRRRQHPLAIAGHRERAQHLALHLEIRRRRVEAVEHGHLLRLPAHGDVLHRLDLQLGLAAPSRDLLERGPRLGRAALRQHEERPLLQAHRSDVVDHLHEQRNRHAPAPSAAGPGSRAASARRRRHPPAPAWPKRCRTCSSSARASPTQRLAGKLLKRSPTAASASACRFILSSA